MKVLAILQNQWFKNPERVQRIYDAHAGDWDHISKLNRAYLFMGCATGRRLRAAFGQWCEPQNIVWHEANPRKAGEASGVFPPDTDHIHKFLCHHRPDVVICFGRVAADGLRGVLAGVQGRLFPVGGFGPFPEFKSLYAPHPAARGADTCKLLADVRRELDELAAAWEPEGVEGDA